MLSLLVFVAAAFVPIYEIHGAVTTNFDINAILDIIRIQQKIAKSGNNQVESISDSSGESVENEGYNLRSKDLVQLLHQTLDDAQKRRLKQKKETQYKYQTYSNNLVNYKENHDSFEDTKNVNPVEGLLGQFLTQLDKNQRKSPNKLTNRKLKPGSLLVPDIETKDVSNGLSDYSKIYVILNSDAIRSSQNKKQLTDLISRLSANSAPVSQNLDHNLKEERYKSFPIQGSLSRRRSRARRESAEGYGSGGRDSMEDNYKPKRPRNNHGGGGVGGRTAIPYIRHRGDIYAHGN